MEKLIKDTEKLCSFYVSDWHLVTMLLPYMNKEINEKANIITILENNIEENIKTLLSKLNLKNEQKILQIDWKSRKNIKYAEVVEKLNKKENAVNIILVSGSKQYIEDTNKMIDKIVLNEKEKHVDKKFKIINCYEVTQFNNSIKEILDIHDKILNTSGEKEIGEVFDGYSKISEAG